MPQEFQFFLFLECYYTYSLFTVKTIYDLGAKVVRLEQNYRSTGHILNAASALIANNRDRLGKTLHTEDHEGEKVRLQGCWDDEEEARSVCEDIEQLQRQGHTLNEIAILVRASFQMRAFEDRFVTLGLDYRVIGGPRFYERQEIRDATAYFEEADEKYQRPIVTRRFKSSWDLYDRHLYQGGACRLIPCAVNWAMIYFGRPCKII